MELAELLTPCLTISVTRGDILASERVLDDGRVKVLLSIFILLKELAGTMAKQLVQSDDQGQRVVLVPHQQVLIGLRQEHDVLFLGPWVDVAEINVLKTFILADIVIVWNIDADRGTRASKCNDLTNDITLLTKFLLV